MTDHPSSRSQERGHPILPLDLSASAHSLVANTSAVTTPSPLTTPLLVNSSTAALASAAVASAAALVNDTARNASALLLGNSSLRLVQSITDDPNGAAGHIDTRLEKQHILLLMFAVVVLPVLFISACCCFKPRMPWADLTSPPKQ